MASIYGVNLKAVKKTYGMEGEGFTANIYMNNKKIGSVFDYADGGMLNVYLDDMKNEIVRLVRLYYANHPEIDYIKSCTITKTPEEYIKLLEQKKLPCYDPESEPVSNLLELFFEKLCNMHYLEKSFKSCIKKGYSAVVTVDYPMICGIPIPLPVTYYTNGSQKCFNEIQKDAKKKFPVVIINQYDSLESFVIQQP